MIATAPCRNLVARPTEEDIERLAAGGTFVRVERGEKVFAEGDAVDFVYVIRRGEVALSRTVGGRNVTLLLLREGDILGDIPTLLRAPATFDAVAVTDVELVSIAPARVWATLERSPEFARRWVTWLSGRLATTHTRLVSLLAGDIRAQVAALLVQESCRGDVVELTHRDIAAMLGAQRSSVTRAIDELADTGAVATGYGNVRVLDHELLQSFAGGNGATSHNAALSQPPALLPTA